MENELTDPVFGNTPQAPPKWLVLLWCISIVAAVTTEVVRHKIEINFISRFAINVAKLEVQLVFECLTAKLYYLITNLQYCSQMHTRYESTTNDHWIHERFEKVSISNI